MCSIQTFVFLFTFLLSANGQSDYTLIKAGNECKSGDQRLRSSGTLEQCYQACISQSGCEFFLFGINSNAGYCYWDKTSSNSCPEGWNINNYDFYEMGSCTTPSSITGYGNAGATETALKISGFTVTGYTCASGYSGTAAASVCTGGAGSAYVLSGCTACVNGKYTDQNAQSVCKSCYYGYYQDQHKKTACKYCIKGQYQSLQGQPSCKICQTGRNAVNIATRDCATCAKATASTSSTTSCSSCASGRYQENNAATYYNCKTCSTGVYVTSSGCTKCPLGQYQNQGKQNILFFKCFFYKINPFCSTNSIN